MGLGMYVTMSDNARDRAICLRHSIMTQGKAKSWSDRKKRMGEGGRAELGSQKAQTTRDGKKNIPSESEDGPVSVATFLLPSQ